MKKRKVLGVSFSARKEGNCLKLLTYCLNKFKEQGFETEVLNAYVHEIISCSHCNYECFNNKECPLKDDVPPIYRKCVSADILIFSIPTYGASFIPIFRFLGTFAGSLQKFSGMHGKAVEKD